MNDDTHLTTKPETVMERSGARRLEIGALAREHYDAVFRFCARRVGPDRAADAAQDTFLTAQKALSKFRGESSVSTWLFGIAHNECRRIYRMERLDVVPLEFEPEPAQSPNPERMIVDLHALNEAMSRLSEEHRQVVIMHELDGLTYEEAAVILGVPVGTVKSRLHHAFVQLRRSLVPEGIK